ncbi:MAG: ParB/RepB/Spo0J family partition protein, partial [Geminicoccaceae bacterium]
VLRRAGALAGHGAHRLALRSGGRSPHAGRHEPEEQRAMELRTVDPKSLVFNPNNPRRSASSPDADEQMAASIKVVGIIQPPIVKQTADGLEILYGERRVKGAISNGLPVIAVLVVEASTSDHAMAALVENVVRAPLSPVDQWRAIHELEQAGWNAEAIAVTLALPLRTIRKLKLLASIPPPMLDHIAQGELPNERELRLIVNASLEEQATVWKKHRPKKGQSVVWWEIARALDQRKMLARHARFDDAIAQAFGIAWMDDLFAPADEDSRYTTQVDAFLAAQEAWLEQNLPANGVRLALDQYGQPKLPAKAQRLYGAKPRKTDTIGHYLDARTGEIKTIAFRLPEPATKPKQGTAAGTPEAPPKATRPAVTKKGMALIGELRTAALHQALAAAEIDDPTLIGLLVLAFAGENVTVLSPGDSYHAETKRAAYPLVEGGSLTTDPATLRRSARAMLAAVLSCQVGASGSGTMARHAGAVIGADAWLPSMATEEFLGCLSKAALNEVAMASEVGKYERAKDTRAALCRAFRERTYVHPQARFALTAEELAAERRGSVPDPSGLKPEAAAGGGDAGGEIPAGEMADDGVGGPEVDADEQDPIAA